MEPTPRTLSEADRVDLVYAYVLSQVGAKTSTEVLALWQSVPVGQAAQTITTWLARAIDLILTQRWRARELGIAYYRLARALRTGTVTANPLIDEEPEQVSLEMLRQEFEALVAAVTGEGTTAITAGVEPDGDDDAIVVERINGFTEALAADESSAKPYVTQLLNDMADAATAKVEGMSPDITNGEAKVTGTSIHAQHGAMIAGAAGRVAMNGARNATNQVSARDPRIIGWVRQHGQSDKPCYFCSMLISRRVLYKSDASAGKGRESSNDGRKFLGDGIAKFHDNCHCVTEPLYSDESFGTSPKFAMNRYYGDLWDKHMHDSKGQMKFAPDEAINEWRKILARIRATETKPAAQAAA